MELAKIVEWANAIIEAEKSIESASIAGYDNMKHVINGVQQLTAVVVDMNKVVQEAVKNET